MTGGPPIPFPSPMLLFGCGNMAGAMVQGWMAAGVPAASFHIVKPTDRNLPPGARYFSDAGQVPGKYETILIGIKPQNLAAMADDIRALLSPGALVISILGGVATDSLMRHFPDARILRVMPNLAVALGKSPLGLFARGLDDADQRTAESWLAPLGTPYWLVQEADMHAFTALAGCGPAYLYRFIDAMAQAAEQMGIEPVPAARLAREMIEGAALLAARSSDTPGELAARVASKGGSTAAGLAMLDRDEALNNLIAVTLRAARDRSIEQGKEAE